jgi:salicylate hydroxylase
MNHHGACSEGAINHVEEIIESNDARKCSVAIIGAGLTGLATALMLANEPTAAVVSPDSRKRSIHVFDRDASFSARKEGYGLTLTYNPEGILDELANADCPSRSHYVIRQSTNKNEGEVIGYFGNAFDTVNETDDVEYMRNYGWGQRGNLRVPRQVVRQILLRRLHDIAPNVTIYWNHNLVNVTKNCDTSLLELHFANGNAVKGIGIVIGADGIYSSVVRCCLPNIPPPQSLGVRVILGITGGGEHDNQKTGFLHVG